METAEFRTEGMALGAVADLAMPASAPMREVAEEKSTVAARGGSAGESPQASSQPMIRREFADLAFWAGSVESDKDGNAEVSFKMPENLTDWKIRTWTMGSGTRVGQGESDVVTTKNLLVRLQAPRFFVEKDEVVLSANIHNYLATEQLVKARLELSPERFELVEEAEKEVVVKSNGEERVNWRVKVLSEGEAVIRMFALAKDESDAMEVKLPVQVHGMLKTESVSGMIKPTESEKTFSFEVPKERRPEQSVVEIRYSPTLAGALVDALPYLVNYPYGCTEQTLSRFLPTVITQSILKNMGLDLRAIQEKRTNLNAQEIGDDKERAKQWKRYEENPVFDIAEVSKMAKSGIDRLAAMQLSDGGWGWFSGWGEKSHAHTTAYVVHGLQVTERNKLAIDPKVLSRGIDWLKAEQAEQVQRLKNVATKTEPWKSHADDLDAFVFMVLTDASAQDDEMREFLFRDRTHLSVYAKAMFGIAIERLKDGVKLKEVLKNIEQYLVIDNENQTAYLKLPSETAWWNWYGSEIESQSYYLKLLAKTEPKGEVAPRLVKYLLNNRKHATYWNSTRDTAIAIEAISEFLIASGEDKPDMTVEIVVDGKREKEVRINKENLFTFDNKVLLVGERIASGTHSVKILKKGNGPLYFNAYVTNFTLEDYIKKAGLEIKVDRKYYKLTPSNATALSQGGRGQALREKIEKYDRTEVENLTILKSGDLVEIELEIDSKNDYEYLVFEDMKPAGFEPLEVRSGYSGNDMGAYIEYRDNRVAFFVRSLLRGKHSLSYRMKAEIPGKFSALPTKGYAMYAPELRANSDEIKLGIED